MLVINHSCGEEEASDVLVPGSVRSWLIVSSWCLQLLTCLHHLLSHSEHTCTFISTPVDRLCGGGEEVWALWNGDRTQAAGPRWIQSESPLHASLFTTACSLRPNWDKWVVVPVRSGPAPPQNVKFMNVFKSDLNKIIVPGCRPVNWVRSHVLNLI